MKVGLVIILLISCYYLSAQNLKGTVTDNNNIPVPYAHIFIKNSDIGTTTDDKGNYNIHLREGNYELVISSLGYKTINIPIIIYNKDLTKNILLETSSVELEQVIIKANRRDPAYEIIQSAIKNKNLNDKELQSSKCDIYIKAKEVVSEKEKKKREKIEEQKKIEETKDIKQDNPLSEEYRKELKMVANTNLVEIKLERNYQYPDKIKEIRKAFDRYGDSEGLFYLSTNEGTFNFYNNLIYINNLNSTPIISPLNPTSVLSYKFKLENSYYEKGKQIFHIKVTPRKQGNSTFEGYVDIIDSSFAIRKVELFLEKGGLMFYDYLKINQDYILINDSIWVTDRQEFDYYTKSGKREFQGNTTVKYSNYEINIDYPKRFFKNEIAVTEKDAYDKDSTYWANTRPEPLSNEELRIIFIKDSIYAAHNKKEYLDSLDRAYNRITYGDVFLWGIGHYNREKKQHIWFGSLPSLINVFSVGGVRVGPNFSYSKRFKNEQYFNLFSYVNMGIRNQDIKGNLYTRFMYDPFKLSTIRFSCGKSFRVVQPYESFIGYMDRSNYVEAIYGSLNHSHEIINGLYLNIGISLQENSPIDDYIFGNLNQAFIENNKPRSFNPYQMFQSEISAEYVMFQKYITEPKRKVVLGSNWPTISLKYTKGWSIILGSDIDFDFLEASIKQKFRISTIGTSTVLLASGKFLNTGKMMYENYKIFPRSDKWFFSTPMQNQLQDTTFITDDYYFEAHYVHSFDGSLIASIPLLNKLKLYETAGVNYTWIKDGNYHYVDTYFGIEKSIRIQRQLFRLGFYFVYGGSSNQFAKPSIQFSINHYDKSDGSWDE